MKRGKWQSLSSLWEQRPTPPTGKCVMWKLNLMTFKLINFLTLKHLKSTVPGTWSALHEYWLNCFLPFLPKQKRADFPVSLSGVCVPSFLSMPLHGLPLKRLICNWALWGKCWCLFSGCYCYCKFNCFKNLKILLLVCRNANYFF